RFTLPEALEIPEEEQLVGLHRSAERAAVLMLAERLRGRRRPLHRIELRIARELVQRSMQGIGAGSGRRVQGRTVATVLRAVCVGQDLELADRIDAEAGSQNARSRSAILVVLDLGPVHQNLL